jgi:hypothetical protein
MEDLPYEKLFANNMWNSPNTQIPLVVSKGGEQGLSIFLPQYETPPNFFFLFGPTNILKRLCVMNNIYAIQELEGGGAKGRMNWVWFTMHELRFLIGSFDFHNHQEITPH